MKLIKSSTENYNIKDLKNKVLIDINSKGKEIDWQDKKLRTLDLSDSYYRLGKQFINKHYRVKDCGTYLEYKRFTDKTMKLNQANFCKVRLCPMCSWRRSLKIFGQVSKIMDFMTQQDEYQYIFITLTNRNVTGENLSSSINELFKGYKKLTSRSRYKNSFKGHFRALEVTHNLKDPNSKWYDTYHPHIHSILAVNKSYFVSRDYISQDELALLWQDCLGVDYKPTVHITKPKDIKRQGIAKTIAEVAKYTTKSDDYIIHDNVTNDIIEDMTDSAVYYLDKALANRRLTAFGGVFKEIHQQLNLDDTEDGDLINTDNNDLNSDLEFVIEKYFWHIGYKQYLKI